MRQTEIAVIDYGVGNLLSVRRALEQCGAKVILTADHKQILQATHVILPGVGAFRSAMQALERLELIDTIRRVAANDIPLLGICLGMQLLLDESEEFGRTPGLSLIPGRVIPIPSKTAVEGVAHKIPHVGWNELHASSAVNSWKQTLLQDTQYLDAVYFVHSFMAVPNDVQHRISDCFYGQHRIAAVIKRDNVSGCQFHPEKSGEVGLRILQKFVMT